MTTSNVDRIVFIKVESKNHTLFHISISLLSFEINKFINRAGTKLHYISESCFISFDFNILNNRGCEKYTALTAEHLSQEVTYCFSLKRRALYEPTGAIQW